MPGSKHNVNAGSHGLYSKHPSMQVTLPGGREMRWLKPDEVAIATLTPLAGDMADAAAWIAEELSDPAKMAALDGKGQVDAAKLAGLYAKVASELYQLAGELGGETGIKAANLGTLTEASWDGMMRNLLRMLALILSQIKTATSKLKTGEELFKGEGGLILAGDLNPVLAYLANHMRNAKRMLEEMAADVAWRRKKENGVTSFNERWLRDQNVAEGTNETGDE